MHSNLSKPKSSQWIGSSITSLILEFYRIYHIITGLSRIQLPHTFEICCIDNLCNDALDVLDEVHRGHDLPSAVHVVASTTPFWKRVEDNDVSALHLTAEANSKEVIERHCHIELEMGRVKHQG